MSQIRLFLLSGLIASIIGIFLVEIGTVRIDKRVLNAQPKSSDRAYLMGYDQAEKLITLHSESEFGFYEILFLIKQSRSSMSTPHLSVRETSIYEKGFNERLYEEMRNVGWVFTPLKLQKGDKIVTIGFGHKIVINLNESDKPSYELGMLKLKKYNVLIYEHFDFDSKRIVTDKTMLNLSDIANISILEGTMAKENAVNSALFFGAAGALLGQGLILGTPGGGNLGDMLGIGVACGALFAIPGSIGGGIQGAFYPKISKTMVLGENEWKVVQ